MLRILVPILYIIISGTLSIGRAIQPEERVQEAKHGDPAPDLTSVAWRMPDSTRSIIVRRVNKVPFSLPSDFIYRPQNQCFYVVQSDGALLQCELISGKHQRIQLPIEVFTIGSDASDIYLYSSAGWLLLATKDFHRFDTVTENLSIRCITQTSGGKLLLLPDESVIESIDTVYILSQRSLHHLLSVDATMMSDMVELGENRYLYVNYGEGVIYELRNGTPSSLVKEIENVDVLSVHKGYAYALGGGGQVLYKIDAEGNAWELRLPAIQQDAGSAGAFARGLQFGDDDKVYYLNGEYIIEADLRNAIWQPLHNR